MEKGTVSAERGAGGSASAGSASRMWMVLRISSSVARVGVATVCAEAGMMGERCERVEGGRGGGRTAWRRGFGGVARREGVVVKRRASGRRVRGRRGSIPC